MKPVRRSARKPARKPRAKKAAAGRTQALGGLGKPGKPVPRQAAKPPRAKRSRPSLVADPPRRGRGRLSATVGRRATLPKILRKGSRVLQPMGVRADGRMSGRLHIVAIFLDPNEARAYAKVLREKGAVVEVRTRGES